MDSYFGIRSVLKYLGEELLRPGLSKEEVDKLKSAVESLKSYLPVNEQQGAFVDLPPVFKEKVLEMAKRDTTKAEEEKTLGNSLLTEGKIEQAVEAYTRAIQCDPYNHIYYSNRAAAFIKLNKLDDAETDCHTSLSLNDTYSKAYGRLGSIYMMRNDFFSACPLLEKALSYEPENQVYQDCLKTCKEKMSSPQGAMPDLASMFNNPGIMSIAQNLLQDQNMQQTLSGIMENMQNNPEFANLQNLFRNFQPGENNPPGPQ